ncbi:MAG TPA: NifB/NifX family molybdenum-iron cluster-binding protein, partial [Syntrophorhabdales bacterium]|nr:NifB/NifX family molybdenum-iron cluster-binding protein [Syntrophorhabdales bacterium]
MKICFAVEKDEGMSSAVYGHFGSAPVFVMVDTDSEGVSTVGNRDMEKEHAGKRAPYGCFPGRCLDRRRQKLRKRWGENSDLHSRTLVPPLC